MLGTTERIAFVLLVLACGLVAARGFARIVRIVRQGRPAARSDGLVGRIVGTLIDVGLQRPIFKARPVVSLFHAFLFFGFSFYLLVNVNDVLEAYVDGWSTIGAGGVAGAFNLAADLFSVFVLTGMVFFLVRRFLVRPRALRFNANVLLHPGVAAGGIRRDSLIVGCFILVHVGARWLGTAFHLAGRGAADPYLPTASQVAGALQGLSPATLETGVHVTWWLAMGLIVLFLPYFPYSKHIHLMIAPLNLALGRRTARGAMDAPAAGAEPGAATLAELPWPQVLDAYACIMCLRCQNACPAHASGAPLSPAALEINKRYAINAAQGPLARGEVQLPLLEQAITADAVWACTSCYACVRVCPVGNEPLHDILELRRRLTLEAQVPDSLADALRNLDEQGNSFGESNRRRARWAKELGFEVKDAAAEPVQYLWFVGDFASFNASCQPATRKVAEVLHAAGVDFGILHRDERSAGNDVRRVGEEGLFESLAEHNLALLDKCRFETILTTDPHTYNALKNEYAQRGAAWRVVHYSELLAELIRTGRIRLTQPLGVTATYHDPCYLGRYNGIFDAPREVLRACGVTVREMPRNRENSFCCGAGGGRIWMQDHADVQRRPGELRIDEAVALEAVQYFVTACPKDLTMYGDAVKTSGHEHRLEVRDLIEFVAEAMPLPTRRSEQAA
jgi:Fe-S oxidoreductase